MSKAIFCYKCNQQLVAPAVIGRSWECIHCCADLHCCKMCRFYDESSYNECKEPVADRSLIRKRPIFAIILN